MAGAVKASLLALAIALSACGSNHKPKPVPPPPTSGQSASDWTIGPIVNGANVSVGLPLNPTPTPDGWAIDVPFPNPAAGHLHGVTFHSAPLTGKSALRLRYRVEMDEGTAIYPKDAPGSPSMLTLFLQRRGDNWGARGEYEAFRWFAVFATHLPITAGEHEMTVPLSGNWTAVLTSSALTNPAAFAATLADIDKVGIVFGGGPAVAHGVYSTGPARIIVTGFEVLP